MHISLEELRNAALDARIELTAAEEKELQEEIQLFFKLVKPLQEIDLTGIVTTCYGHQEPNILRADLAQPSLTLEAALANAPAVDESYFLVPRIIED